MPAIRVSAGPGGREVLVGQVSLTETGGLPEDQTQVHRIHGGLGLDVEDAAPDAILPTTGLGYRLAPEFSARGLDVDLEFAALPARVTLPLEIDHEALHALRARLAGNAPAAGECVHDRREHRLEGLVLTQCRPVAEFPRVACFDRDVGHPVRGVLSWISSSVGISTAGPLPVPSRQRLDPEEGRFS